MLSKALGCPRGKSIAPKVSKHVRRQSKSLKFDASPHRILGREQLRFRSAGGLDYRCDKISA